MNRRPAIRWAAAAACLAGTLLAARISSAQPAGTIKMLPNVNFVNAGISLGVPDGFTHQVPGEPFDVVRAVKTEAGRLTQSITLSAYPVAADVTAARFAEAMTAETGKNLAVRGLSVIKRTTMPVANLEAQTHLLTYRFRGTPTAAARLYFLREEKAPAEGAKIRVCYVLTVESVAEKQGTLMPVLGEVLKTIRLSMMEGNLGAPPGPPEPAVKELRLGYSIAPPRFWYATLTPSGAELGRTDYLLGGVPMPLARVIVREQIGGDTAEQCARQSLESLRKNAADQNQQATVISQGAVTMAGRDGYQFVLRQTAAKLATTATSAPVRDGQAVYVAQRTLCTAGGADGTLKSYSIRVYAQSAEAKPVEEILSQLAEGFEVLGPGGRSTTTTSAPEATAPDSNAPSDRGNAN